MPPEINAVGQNLPVQQANEAVNNLNQPDAPRQPNPPMWRTALAEIGFSVLAIATLGFSHIIRMSMEAPAPRNLNQKLPELTAADRRFNDELAQKIGLGNLPRQFVEAQNAALDSLRQTLPTAELTQSARAAWMQRIHESQVKVLPEVAADLLKDVMRDEYLQHNLINDLVAEKARQLSEDFHVSADQANGLSAIITKNSTVVKSLAKGVNFNEPAQVEAFKRGIDQVVHDQVTVRFTALQQMDSLVEAASQKLFKMTLINKEAFASAAKPLFETLKKELSPKVNTLSKNLENGLPTLNSLQDFKDQLQNRLDQVIAQKQKVIDAIRATDIPYTLKKEWIAESLDTGAFISAEVSSTYAAIARDIASNDQNAANLGALLINAQQHPENYSADEVKQCFINLERTIKTRLSADLAPELQQKINSDDKLTTAVCRNIFTAIFTKNRALRDAILNNRDKMADLQEALSRSANEEDCLLAKSLFSSLPEIQTLVKERQLAQEASSRRDELKTAIALGTGQMPPSIQSEIDQARNELKQVFGEGILTGAKPQAGLAFEGTHESLALARLNELAQSDEPCVAGLIGERYKASVIESYFVQLLAETARPIAQQLGSPVKPNVQLLCRNPSVRGRLAGIKTIEDATKLADELSNVLTGLITAEKAVSDAAAEHYTSRITYLAEKSGLTEDEVRSALPFAAFAESLCQPFYASNNSPAQTLNPTDPDKVAVGLVSDELAKQKAAWDARFEAINAAQVPDDVKAVWRKEVVRSGLFANPANVALVVTASGRVSIAALENALNNMAELDAENMATFIRLQMLHINDTLQTEINNAHAAVTSEEADGLCKALVTLLYSQHPQLAQLLNAHREALIPVVSSFNEDAMKARIDAEFSDRDPMEAAAAKRFELDNMRRCSIFWSASHPQVADFVAAIDAPKISANNEALYQAFDSGNLPPEVKDAITKMTSELRKEFGDDIAPEGSLGNYGDIQTVYRTIRTFGKALDYPQCIAMMRDHLIENYLETAVVGPAIRAVPDWQNDPGTANLLIGRITASSFLRDLANKTQDLAALKTAVREAACLQVNVNTKFNVKSKTLQNRFLRAVADAAGMDIDEARSLAEQMLSKLDLEFVHQFTAIARQQKTGLIDEKSVPALHEAMDKVCQKAIDKKIAVIKAIKESDASDELKNQWLSQLLENDAFFSPSVVTAVIAAGRTAAQSDAARQLAAVLAADAPEAPNAAEQCQTLMTNIMRQILASMETLLDQDGLANFNDGDAHGSIVTAALAVCYAEFPALAAAMNQHPQRMLELTQSLSQGQTKAEMDTCLFFLDPSVVQPIKQQRQAAVEAECRAQLQEALRGNGQIPLYYQEAFDNALNKLRNRFGSAVVANDATPLTLPLAESARTSIAQKASEGNLSLQEVEDTFVNEVAESYFREGFVRPMLENIATEENIDLARDSNIVLNQIFHRSGVPVILKSIERPDDIAVAERELRPILREALLRHQALAEQQKAIQAAIAEEGNIPLDQVAQLLDVGDVMTLDSKGIPVDKLTGYPDQQALVDHTNASVEYWKLVFKSINDTPGISDNLKTLWRTQALNDSFFSDPLNAPTAANVGSNLHPQDILKAEPFNAIDFIRSLKTLTVAITRDFEVNSDLIVNDAEAAHAILAQTMAACLDKHAATLRLFNTYKDAIVDAFHRLRSGEFQGTAAGLSQEDIQNIEALLKAPQLKSIREAIDASDGWEFIENHDYLNHIEA